MIHPELQEVQRLSLDSTTSAGSDFEAFEIERGQIDTTKPIKLGILRTTKQIKSYTSIFIKKLLPPLGFYRETEKYSRLRDKFKDDLEKLDALEEMWREYKKYQIQKRFRWPPHLVFDKFFWTTGYYGDYQKDHRATVLRQPGEDSSEEEFYELATQFMIAGGENDINLDEYDRYKDAKKQVKIPTIFNKKMRFHSTHQTHNYLVDKRPTLTRLFGNENEDEEEDEEEEEDEIETNVGNSMGQKSNKNKKQKKHKEKKSKEGGKKKKGRGVKSTEREAGEKVDGDLGEFPGEEGSKKPKEKKKRKSVKSNDSEAEGRVDVDLEELFEMQGEEESKANKEKKKKRKSHAIAD